jgi:hypothetical protein
LRNGTVEQDLDALKNKFIVEAHSFSVHTELASRIPCPPAIPVIINQRRKPEESDNIQVGATLA